MFLKPENHNKLQYFLLFFIAFILYSNTLNHSYTWDDALVIQQNEYTKNGLKGLKDIWTKKVFLHNRDVYRPIPQSIYALTYQLAPNNPTMAHIVNLLFYSIAAVVTFWFLSLLFFDKSKWLLFSISLLFIFHPVHSEVVANIKSLDEILAYIFSILSLGFFFRSFKNHSFKILLISVFCYIIALFSKISAITILPIYFLIIIIYPFNVLEIFHNTYKKIIQTIKKKSISNNIILFYSCILTITIFASLKYDSKILLIIALLVFVLMVSIYKPFFKKFILAIIVLALLTIFKFQTGLIVFSILFLLYLLKNDKPIYTVSFSILFIVAFGLVSQSYGAMFFALIICLGSFVYSKKSQIIPFIFLTTISFITLFIEQEINVVSIGFFLLILLIISRQKIKTPLQVIPFVLIAFIFDSYYFNKSSFINNINFQKEIRIQNNPDIVLSMTPLNNTLFNESNKNRKYATIAKIQLKYLQLLFYPHPLVHQYGFNQIEKTTFKDWKVWFSIIIHLGLFLFALYKLKEKSPIAFGILFYLSTISIYTNIVILMPDTLAERFLFTPSLGFSIVFVFTIDWLLKKLGIKKRTLALSIIISPILLAFSYKTFDRNKAWKNNLTLAENTIQYAENNAAINAQYATELLKANKDSSKIVYHYKKALELYPNFYSASKDLASFYIKNNQATKAEKYLLKCISLQKNDWESYYFLGFLNYENKQYFEAISHFEKALFFGGNFMDTEKIIYTSEFLARCYFNNNELQKADTLLKENYLQHNTKSSMILLANIYHQSGNVLKSLETYQSLLKDYPEDSSLQKTIEILKNQTK